MVRYRLTNGVPDRGAGCPHTSAYLWRVVLPLVGQRPLRVVGVGCGTGAFAAHLASLGHEVVGIDSSSSGIEIARVAHPQLTFINAAAEEAPALAPFDVATCLEVVEHCFLPRNFARGVRALLKPGGMAIFTTPYHGYLKTSSSRSPAGSTPMSAHCGTTDISNSGPNRPSGRFWTRAGSKRGI
jgi:2-polyprenyl-3-methyl-5-hydroxy-6-metoxy-1,4-benzoquinol methylase